MSESFTRPPRPNQITVAGVGLIVGSGIETVASAIATIAAIRDSIGYHELRGLSLLVPLVGILAGGLAVFGGVQLLLGRNRNLVYAGAIASLVPGTLCCVAGGVFGVLALVLLPRPETRAHFGEAVRAQNGSPNAPFAPTWPGHTPPAPRPTTPAADAPPAPDPTPPAADANPPYPDPAIAPQNVDPAAPGADVARQPDRPEEADRPEHPDRPTT
ncbi:hypothetical protein AB0I55_21065 [Actinocatenispora sera]|uniref:hypothetical protein n=1 Tax=Actinocatenispora sera TaxID=390989 RepID=UPI0033C6D5D2